MNDSLPRARSPVLAAAPPAASSRQSRAGAGWTCPPGAYTRLLDAHNHPFHWLDPKPLWRSRNDTLARALGDPTNDLRRAWMATRDTAGNPDLIVDHTGGETVSFLVLGDTGEGDASQYAVVPPLLTQAPGTAFMFVCSDVIYPAGGIGEYERKFLRPYRDYPGPIYAVPGNHDWYDGLTGFMLQFCDAWTPPARAPQPLGSKAWLRDLLGSRPPVADPQRVATMRALRAAPGQQGLQPAPYFVIDTGPVRLVAIDTGITNSIDRDQGAWLRRVSTSSPKPKVLLTGKPIYVDGEHHPGAIEGGGHVDDVVRAPECNYIAAIGGDIHNYQRYPVRQPDGRTILYLVSGGGGAFMHATHTIPRIDPAKLAGVSEDEFRCYPLRGDSLSIYSHLYDRKLAWGRGRLEIPPDEAAAIMADRLKVEPSRPSARQVVPSARSLAAAAKVFALPTRGRGILHFPFSEFFDWDQPPLFKSFLRVDAGADEIAIRCLAATGCADHEQTAPVEDELIARRTGDGWRWEIAGVP